MAIYFDSETVPVNGNSEESNSDGSEDSEIDSSDENTTDSSEDNESESGQDISISFEFEVGSLSNEEMS